MAKAKPVYQIDKDGYFVGIETAFESPLEPGVFLIPAGCAELEPPAVADGNIAQWDGQQWQEVPAPLPEEPSEIPPESPNPYVTFTELETAYTEGVNA